MKGRFSQNIYVEISKGCTGNCNYCLVKKAKGALHSRPIPDILLDIERLYAPDQELFLVADDCGCYGVDSDSNIIELLDAIHARFPELRFKVNYIDPRYLILHSEAFLRIFHTMSISVTMIPLQSGSQRILQKMNRHYDVAESLAVIKRIRQVSPHIMINSHFIVGHPGETWGDFVKTLAAARFFDYPAPFLYSNNAGTVSSQMTDQTSRIVGSLRVSIFILYLNVVMFFRLAESLRTKTT